MANLILYYSRKGENYVNGSIQNLSKGNTERVAEFIRRAVGGDLFEIEPVREYSASYMTCIKEAQAEQRGKGTQNQDFPDPEMMMLHRHLLV